MNTATIVSGSFNSTHEDVACSPHLHGHTFEVQVREEGTIAGIMPHLLETALDGILAELNGRPLGDMLYGGSQSLEGIAAWICERLLVTHPRVTAVSVRAGRRDALVEREIR